MQSNYGQSTQYGYILHCTDYPVDWSIPLKVWKNYTRFFTQIPETGLQTGPVPCATTINLTEKLFGVGSSNFGIVNLDNWQHTNINKQDARTKCVGHHLI